MADLIIRRNSEWANKKRVYALFLNGIKISEIKDRQVLKFKLPEGKYQLIAKTGWCGSKPLNIEMVEGEDRSVEIKGFIFSQYFLPVALVTSLLYFILYLKFQINSLLLATLLMFYLGYLLFFISIGRDYFLRLKEV